jgi:nucleotide-binding universal stress UspA family protein
MKPLVPIPLYMPLSGDSTILVPVDVSVAEPPDQGILQLLRPVNVVVLGYYPVPKQTAPAHLKADHESEAAARLDDIVAQFDSSGHGVEGVLVFTKDREDTIDRIADQHDCDAVLIPNEIGSIERILVPLRGDVNLERIVSFVGDLLRMNDATVTLFHASAAGADPSQGEFMLRGAADRLSEDGVDSERIDWILSEDSDPASAIVDVAAEYDLVILGETEPTLRERIIGTVLTPVLDKIDKSTIIVRDID